MKCLSIDLDGTLVNDNHEITQKSIEVLKKAKENGIKVVINTGRILEDIKKVPALLDLKVPIISMNGSIIYNEEGNVIYETNMDKKDYKEILEKLKEMRVGILVYTNKGVFPASMATIMSDKEKGEKMLKEFNYEHILSITDVTIYKVIAIADEKELLKLEEVKKMVKEYKTLTFGSSWIFNVEITSSSADKGLALKKLEELSKEKFEKIIAFGDNGNDVSQLKVADIAVVMGNASDEIKKHGDIITKSNNEDGVAYAIEHILNLL